MVHYCCCFGCKEKYVKGGGITFHSFPQNKSIRQLWVHNIRRKNFVPSKYSKVCSKHFTEECFDREKFGGIWLKPDAVPTIFDFSPEATTMAEGCAAYNCFSRRRRNNCKIAFYRFPLNRPDMLHKWLAAMKCEDLQPTEQHRLCSLHFKDSCFDNRTLRWDAVPTLFEHPTKEDQDETKQPLDFSKICRLCLVESSELLPMFDKKLQTKLSKLSLDIQMSEGDELPQQVCQQCIQHVNSSYFFKLQCQRSHSSLVQQLQSASKETEMQQDMDAAITSVSMEEEEETETDDDADSDVENQPQQLLRRKLTLLPRVHTCEVCARSFRTRGTLKKHAQSHLVHQCKHCNKTLQSAAKLREHLIVVHAEEKPYTCNLCGQEFPYKSTLKTHIRVHTGEKPFRCEICGRQFGQKHSLEEHQVVHTNDQPHVCDVCGVRYRQFRSLKLHMEGHSAQPRPPKPIIRWCEYCGRGFNAVASFQRHVMTHTGKKPFSCEFCDKRFAVKSKLLEHSVTHTKDQPFCCHECGKLFQTKDTLSRHIHQQHT